MVKFNGNTRLKVVKDVLENGLSENEAARKHGMSHTTVNEWVAAYSKHGAEGIAVKNTKRTYSGEQKQSIVEDMRNNRLSYKAAAKKHDVPDRSVRKWEQIYLKEGAPGLYVERRGRVANKEVQIEIEPPTGSIEALIKENQTLRMELAYLKKLNALVQEKNASRTTTKLM